MSDSTNLSLDNCGCCEPDPVLPQLYNRPGLPALAYRAGMYTTFFRHMLALLGTYTLPDGDFGGTRPLGPLTTRTSDDPSIALLDASAIVADVLTFYQERIANEGFLRTATERRSILELARAIGYELNPGVAASAYLAFTIEDALGAPGLADIPTGTKVQSVPPQGQMPQTFETSTDLKAYAAWNAISPRLSQTQNLVTGISQIYLSGTDTGLKVGDVVLVTSTVNSAAAHVLKINVDYTKKLTQVIFNEALPSLGGVPGSLSVTLWGGQKIPFNDTTIQQEILRKSWKDADLNVFLKANDWDPQALVDYVNHYRANNPSTIGYAFALRTRLGIFGSNAPKYETLPASQRFGEWITDPGDKYNKIFKGPAYGAPWEGRFITTDSQGGSINNSGFYLDRSTPAVQPGGYVVLENSAGLSVYPITGVTETSLSDYGMSAKVSKLTVSLPFSSPVLNKFEVRATTAYVQSEALTPAELPLTAALAQGATELELNGFFFGLVVGQPIILSGERADADKLTQSEVLFIKDIHHNSGLTTLKFETGLAYPYQRDTVTLNANVALATHGETTTEILGAGNGALAHQQFTLKKPPLTYTTSPTASGSTSTLQLRVNNLLWDEAPSLYELEPSDQSYTLRLNDESQTTVIVGDGVKGARLPTGVNNLVATYRSGIGLAGEVEAGSLTILQSKPLGLRSVTNPLAASGAGDPEKMEKARTNAPLTVRTLDRIISQDDYEDFARAFAGIGKAQAIELWNGEQRLIHLTIAGAGEKPITDAKFLKNFKEALDAARDPIQSVQVNTFDQLLFNVVANVAVDGRYVTSAIFAALQTALEDAFAFARRSFGQAVTTAEVITVIQHVSGVVYVDLDSLYLSQDSQTLEQILPAHIAHVEKSVIKPAQLLLINSLGITLLEVQA